MSRFTYEVIALSLLVGAAPGMASLEVRAAEHASVEDFASRKTPPSFASPEDAAEAFKSALAANDFDKVATLWASTPPRQRPATVPPTPSR
jgi:hypothetical protein